MREMHARQCIRTEVIAAPCCKHSQLNFDFEGKILRGTATSAGYIRSLEKLACQRVKPVELAMQKGYDCNHVVGWDTDELTTFPILTIPGRVARHILLLLCLLLLLAPLEEMFEKLELSIYDAQEEHRRREKKSHVDVRESIITLVCYSQYESRGKDWITTHYKVLAFCLNDVESCHHHPES